MRCPKLLTFSRAFDRLPELARLHFRFRFQNRRPPLQRPSRPALCLSFPLTPTSSRVRSPSAWSKRSSIVLERAISRASILAKSRKVPASYIIFEITTVTPFNCTNLFSGDRNPKNFLHNTHAVQGQGVHPVGGFKKSPRNCARNGFYVMEPVGRSRTYLNISVKPWRTLRRKCAAGRRATAVGPSRTRLYRADRAGEKSHDVCRASVLVSCGWWRISRSAGKAIFRISRIFPDEEKDGPASRNLPDFVASRSVAEAINCNFIIVVVYLLPEKITLRAANYYYRR